MNEKIFNVLKKILELESVDETISQKNCTKWDSMNHLKIIIELETEFDLSFEPEEIAEMKSYQEISRIISQKNDNV